MELYTLNGETLFSSNHHTIKETLEEAVRQQVDLARINLRRAKLRHAALDGIHAPGASFWGADMTGADMAGGQLEKGDFRLATFKETCLAESGCKKCDFTGAYFNNVLLEKTDLAGSRFSCPSFLTQDLSSALLKGAVYWHQGETPCPLDGAPIALCAPPHRVFIVGKTLICNGTLCA